MFNDVGPNGPGYASAVLCIIAFQNVSAKFFTQYNFTLLQDVLNRTSQKLKC